MNCRIGGCRAEVPGELVPEGLCLHHYTVQVDLNCSGMRRETALNVLSAERREEILQYLAATGEHLAHLATGHIALSDEMKARILNTFLTLMNLRESLERSANRARQLQAAAGKGPAQDSATAGH